MIIAHLTHHLDALKACSLTYRPWYIVAVYNAMTQLPREVTLSDTLRTMNEIKPFKLVFLLEVLDPAQVEPQRRLAEALDPVTVDGLLGFLDSPSTIRVARSPANPTEL